VKKNLVELLEDLGVNTQNIRVTSSFTEFKNWVKEYVREWYKKDDELITTVIEKSALDGGMFILPHLDNRIDVYLASRDDTTVYSALGSILQFMLGIKLSGAFCIEPIGCDENAIKGIQMISLMLNSVLVNLIEEAVSHALVSMIASNKYHKGIRKSMKKLKKNLEKAVSEGLIPVSYGMWGIWIIDSVFFGKDEVVEKLTREVGVIRSKEKVLELIRYILKRGKDFGVNIILKERNRGRTNVYVLESRAILKC
jgi:hypothetical protein